MPPFLETVAVVAIVGVALVLSGRTLLRSVRGRGSRCSCAVKDCPAYETCDQLPPEDLHACEVVRRGEGGGKPQEADSTTTSWAALSTTKGESPSST